MWNLTTSNEKQTKPIDTEYRPVVIEEKDKMMTTVKRYTLPVMINVARQRIAWWLE